MKYNILTVANEDYSPFIKLFVNSLFEFVDTKNVNKIYIFDTGLSQITLNYLNHFPQVEIRNTDISAPSSEIHDEGWQKNTYSKTKFLLSVLEETRLPTLMIDSDSIFVSNFEDLIDWNSDIVACNRNREGFSKHIGSFFGAIDVNNSIEFLQKWIKNIAELQEKGNLKHCESPALSKTILEEEGVNIFEIEEILVSAVFPDKKSRIYHLKSDYYAKTIESRLSLPHAIQYFKRYL